MKDYAKLIAHRARKKKKAPLIRLRWVLLFLILGGIGASLALHPSQRKRLKSFWERLIHPSKPLPSEHLAPPPKPQFDFYNILPTDTHTAKHPRQKASTPTPRVVRSFELQVASFQKQADAEQMKAELTLMGFSVHIQSIVSDNRPWFRILLGPYHTQALALSEQKRLKNQNIDSLLVKHP